MDKFGSGLVLTVAAMIMAGSARAQIAQTVTVEAGQVQGAAPDERGVLAYKGIPYATPPVGPLRWKPPQPASPWTGVREARGFGPGCWAASIPGPPRPIGPPQSEDCLSLNVWTQASGGDRPKPVMVWVHGGGFAFGSSAMPAYDGSRLAARGVVVVSLNYRLGVFGFLAHPELDRESGGSGAFGLQDQVAALRWVRKNIAAFGGDPNNVTLFGESAGAHAVGLLMASADAKGLFHKVIAQSGAFWDSARGSILSHEQALTKGSALASRHGGDLASLRALPAEELNAATAWKFGSDPSETAFAPSMDGQLLKEAPAAVFEHGAQSDVPLLGGWNAVEDLIFRSLALPHGTPEEFARAARSKFGDERMAEFDRLYPHVTPEQATAAAFQLIGDLTITEQTWELLGLQKRTGRTPVYAYQFSYTSPYSPVAAHVADVPFVFGTLTPQYFAPQAPAAGESDQHMSDLMMAYWTNFAKRGDPNGSGLPHWPAYMGPGSNLMHLQAATGAAPETGTERFRFIASFRRDGRLPDWTK